jgi:hypothetical protein
LSLLETRCTISVINKCLITTVAPSNDTSWGGLRIEEPLEKSVRVLGI